MVNTDRPRPCTVCLANGTRIDATHVAGTADGFEWYECGYHEPLDNVAKVVRAKLTPIAEWFEANGLPVPGAPPAPEAEPAPAAAHPARRRGRTDA